MDFAANAQGLVSRSGLLDAGHSPTGIQSLLRAGELLRVARGVYLPAGALGDWERPGERAERLYRYRCLAEAPGDAVLSHQSAAVVHRLPLLRPDLRRIHVLSGRPTGGRVQPHRHIHVGAFDDDVVTVDGVAVTDLARTAVDVAASGTFAQALAVFDAALARGVDRETLAEVLDRRRRTGRGRTRRALAFADPLSANPGESWGRAQLIDAGLPVPRLQVRYVLPDGREAFVDYDWEGRLVGEFDGFAKYTRGRRPGESEGDVVAREKVREDGLRALDLAVVRGIWRDYERRVWVPRVADRLRAVGLYRAG